MFRRVLFIGLLTTLLIGFSSGYLAGYGYYQDATVNNTGSNLTNYQVMFVVNTSSGTSSGSTLYLNSHSEADLDDLRFTSTSDTIYDYWIESAASPYNVWVEVPSITTGNTTLRVQYGNAGASSYTNGTNTFRFYDHFPGSSIDATKWTRVAGSSGSTSVASSILHMAGGSGAYEFQAGTAIAANPIAVRMLVKMDEANYNELGLGAASGINREGIVYDGGKYNYGRISGPGYTKTSRATDISGDYHTLDVLGASSSLVTVKIDGSSMGTVTSNIPTVSLGAFFIATGASVDIYADWVVVRNYTSTEPTVPAWSAESTTSTAPVAAFSGNVTSGVQPLTVLFTDASTNTPTSWAWSFDDGEANSTQQNPTRTFDDVGLYTIILTATNLAGSDSEEKVDYINVTSGAPVAAFSANRTTGGPGDVLFTDSSTNTPTGWAWSWGDGTANGTTQNPTHTYAAGTWTVTLTATNAYGSDSEVKTNYITITNPPIAAFHANVTTGAVPLTVLFTDDSTGTPTSWAWDVNYNSGTDYATQNATHTYAAAGTYSVRLNATNAGGSDDEIKNNYIVAYVISAFPGCSAAPTDIDADGYYEDINGNARLDWSDLILFFTHLTWAKNTEPNALFDFANDGGTITYSDVNALYPEVSAAV